MSIMDTCLKWAHDYNGHMTIMDTYLSGFDRVTRIPNFDLTRVHKSIANQYQKFHKV